MRLLPKSPSSSDLPSSSPTAVQLTMEHARLSAQLQPPLEDTAPTSPGGVSDCDDLPSFTESPPPVMTTCEPSEQTCDKVDEAHEATSAPADVLSDSLEGMHQNHHFVVYTPALFEPRPTYGSGANPLSKILNMDDSEVHLDVNVKQECDEDHGAETMDVDGSHHELSATPTNSSSSLNVVDQEASTSPFTSSPQDSLRNGSSETTSTAYSGGKAEDTERTARRRARQRVYYREKKEWVKSVLDENAAMCIKVAQERKLRADSDHGMELWKEEAFCEKQGRLEEKAARERAERQNEETANYWAQQKFMIAGRLMSFNTIEAEFEQCQRVTIYQNRWAQLLAQEKEVQRKHSEMLLAAANAPRLTYTQLEGTLKEIIAHRPSRELANFPMLMADFGDRGERDERTE